MAWHLPVYNKKDNVLLSDITKNTKNTSTKSILNWILYDFIDWKIIDKPKSLYKNFDRKKHYISLSREIQNYDEYKKYKDNPDDKYENVFVITKDWIDDEWYDYEINVEIHIDNYSHLISSIYFVI